MEIILVLITHSSTHEDSNILNAVCKIIDRFLITDHGIAFLIDRSDFSNSLIRFSLAHDAVSLNALHTNYIKLLLSLILGVKLYHQ